jgi:hypothetical protein
MMPSNLFYVLTILAGIQLALGSPPTSQYVLKSEAIPDGQIVTLDPSWFSDSTTDSTNILIDGSDLNIIVPVGFSVDPPPAFPDYNTEVTQQSLPSLLELFGVDESEISALVEEAIPIFNEALAALFVHQSKNTAQFGALDVFPDMVTWVKKVISKAANVVQDNAVSIVCAVFGAALEPGFEAVAILFLMLNVLKTSGPTVNDQDFYLFPVYGTISHADGIVINYDAAYPPFFESFGSVDAITLHNIIYTKSLASSASYTDPQFSAATRILIHEFTHITQYKALGYFGSGFGTKYLYQFCKVSKLYEGSQI